LGANLRALGQRHFVSIVMRITTFGESHHFAGQVQTKGEGGSQAGGAIINGGAVNGGAFKGVAVKEDSFETGGRRGSAVRSARQENRATTVVSLVHEEQKT
jgi:hypothetical protein